eukprot:GILI01015581.1.p1 GENE.GILI01015581.1~~GILI01015581.1.p1  ORF type:complete len:203 (-),score=53.05 GILI01015581.1:260-868(-)
MQAERADLVGLQNVLHDVKSILQDHQKEFATIHDIYTSQSDIQATFEFKETNAKQLIKDLTSKVERLSKEAQRPYPEREFHGRVQQLEEEKAKVSGEVDRLKTEKEELAESLQRLKLEEAEVDRKLKEIAQAHEVEIPQSKQRLGLYMNVSKINWDFLTEDVAGSITRPERLRPFRFSKQEHSQFFIANQLWDMIALEASLS